MTAARRPEEPRPARAPGHAGWLRRMGWLLLIWAASVGALALAAWLLRLFMVWAGMRPA